MGAQEVGRASPVYTVTAHLICSQPPDREERRESHLWLIAFNGSFFLFSTKRADLGLPGNCI